jgi:hypothetical protein
VPTGDAVLFDDPNIVGTALWTFSRVSHDGLLLRCRAARERVRLGVRMGPT